MKAELLDHFSAYRRKIFGHDSAKGVILIIMVVIAMIWANSPWAHLYHQVWKIPITFSIHDFTITRDLHHWITDGLMAYFFFMIGLEVKREVINGELSVAKKAALPLIAALGGMLVPASLYLAFNWEGEAAMGWGIPMATDIAFAVGLIALVGEHISRTSKTYLTALATFDDIGAILVIAFLLTTGINTGNLMAAGIYFLVMIGGNLIGVRTVWFYLIIGIFGLWIALLLSGIHATLAGVLAAFTIPASTRIRESEFSRRMLAKSKAFRNTRVTEDPLLTPPQVEIIQEVIADSKKALTPLQRVENNIRPVVVYFVLPIFALANAGVTIEGNFLAMVTHPVSLGIIAGLFVGKLGGIFLASKLAVSTSIGKLPAGTTWSEVSGLAMMAGIGFTMSIFIAELSLPNEHLLQIAKVGILTGSLISAIFGLVWLRYLHTRLANPSGLDQDMSN